MGSIFRGVIVLLFVGVVSCAPPGKQADPPSEDAAVDGGAVPEPVDARAEPGIDATSPVEASVPDADVMDATPDVSVPPVDTAVEAGVKKAAWTVLVYMAADNNLEMYAIDDLNEMLAANISDDVNVLVQIDRAQGFFELGIGGVANWQTMKRFRVRQNKLEELVDLGEQNTGDPETLTDFVKWGFSSYPAEHQLLVLWDHGNAWQGYGGDDTSDHDRLDQSEIESSIAEGITSSGLDSVDLIGFDACLMSTFVSSEAMRHFTRYYIASEEFEPGHGWDYTAVLSYLSSHLAGTPAELGTAIADSYYEQARAERKHNDVTISLLDLENYEPVRKAFDTLVEQLLQELAVQKTVVATRPRASSAWRRESLVPAVLPTVVPAWATAAWPLRRASPFRVAAAVTWPLPSACVDFARVVARPAGRASVGSWRRRAAD
jgi:hypothetical protein